MEKVKNKMKQDLEKYKNLVDKQLKIFFKKQIKKSQQIDKSAEQAMKAIEEFTLRGGKRIRAALIFYGYKCFSDQKLEEVIKASMIMELVQTYLLIHDDIMDRDDLRRGGNTMHKIFEKNSEKEFHFKKDDQEREHLGRSLAIITGDICSALAGNIILESNFKNKNLAVRKLNEIIVKVNYGQIIDVRSNYKKKFSEAETLKVYSLKTGTYTIEAPLIVGAILAGAQEKEMRPLKKYAHYLGLAFNIQDDILELFGNKKKLGKTFGSDLKEGKKTLLIIKSFEEANTQDKKFIQENLGNKNLKQKEIEKFKQIMIKTGALDYCRKEAQKYIIQAKKALKKINYKKEGQQFLECIADYMLEREH